MTRAFGYLKDPADPRDKLAIRRPLGAGAQRPPVTHNLTLLRRSRFQEGNSCVGNSWASVLHWFWSRDTGQDIELSAQHLYQHGLLALPGAAELEVQPDGGCYPRDVCRAAQKLGCALERDWPSNRFNTGRRPPPAISSTGLRFAGYEYRRVPIDQGSLLDAIAEGPVQVGGPWWESWSAYKPTSSALDLKTALRAPEPGEIMEGGHAYVAIDYDLTAGPEPLVLCGNTWPDFGFETANQWHPGKPLRSLMWMRLSALVPPVSSHHQITDAWTLASVPAGGIAP